MKIGELLHSSKNNTTYAVLTIGQNHVYDHWQKTNNKWVRHNLVAKCAADQMVLQEIKEWGKVVVFNTADIQAAIAAGTIKETN